MADDSQRGKVKIQGRIPRDEFEEYTRLQERWGIDNGDAFRRVFSAGLDAQKTLREHLKSAVVNLSAIAVVMWVIGRVMPNIPADSASLAAFLTFGVAAFGVVLIGLLDMNWQWIRAGSSAEATD